MQNALTIILADYLTGRISTTEALQQSGMQAVDDLVRAVRSEPEDVVADRRRSAGSEVGLRRRA